MTGRNEMLNECCLIDTELVAGAVLPQDRFGLNRGQINSRMMSPKTILVCMQNSFLKPDQSDRCETLPVPLGESGNGG